MLAITPHYEITWKKLPDDFVLDDQPVDNINQPSLAAALTESLEIACKLPANALTTTNYGICATLNQRIVVKAPDWAYVPAITVSREEVNRSYTPQLQGEIPAIAMEFLSDTEEKGVSILSSLPILQGSGFFISESSRFPTTQFLSQKQEIWRFIN